MFVYVGREVRTKVEVNIAFCIMISVGKKCLFNVGFREKYSKLFQSFGVGCQVCRLCIVDLLQPKSFEGLLI
jgi:hypothetical protein